MFPEEVTVKVFTENESSLPSIGTDTGQEDQSDKQQELHVDLVKWKVTTNFRFSILYMDSIYFPKSENKTPLPN